MRSFGEEIERNYSFYDIFICEELNIAGLCGRIAGEINELFWSLFKKFFDKFFVATGAGRVEDDGLVGRDEVEHGF